jgi:hypothetical protein
MSPSAVVYNGRHEPLTKKAARKAARKEVRARRNAELKKLESADYKPGGYDPNYPENAQGAEKKAGVAPPQQ